VVPVFKKSWGSNVKTTRFKKAFVLAVAAAFLMVSLAAAYAAEKQWVVIKDSTGKCSVKQTSKGKTPKTIAGPFATKEEAKKAKDKECPKVKDKEKKKESSGKVPITSPGK